MSFTDALFDLDPITPQVEPHQDELNFDDTHLADRYAQVAAFNAAMNKVRRMADARARGDHADMHNIRHSLTPQQAKFVLDYAAGSLLATRRRQHRDTRRTA